MSWLTSLLIKSVSDRLPDRLPARRSWPSPLSISCWAAVAKLVPLPTAASRSLKVGASVLSVMLGARFKTVMNRRARVRLLLAWLLGRPGLPAAAAAPYLVPHAAIEPLDPVDRLFRNEDAFAVDEFAFLRRVHHAIANACPMVRPFLFLRQPDAHAHAHIAAIGFA